MRYALRAAAFLAALLPAFLLSGCGDVEGVFGMDDPEHTLVLRAVEADAGAGLSDAQIDRTIAILRQRIDSLGAVRPEITTRATDDGALFTVVVPDVPRDELIAALTQAGQLTFRPVWAITDPSPSSGRGKRADAGVPVQGTENDRGFQRAVLALDCTGSTSASRSGGQPDDPRRWLGACDGEGAAKYLLRPAVLEGSQVTAATAELLRDADEWIVAMTFDDAAADVLARFSENLSRKAPPRNQFAIVVDGAVVSAPSFEARIDGGEAQISGNFTLQEAEDLAAVVNSGSLEAPLEVVG